MIRTSQSNQSVNRMKWGLILVVTVLLITIIYMLVLYNNIERSKTASFDKTEELVLNKTEVTEIETISHFQAENAYDIVFGKTKENDRLIVFVPQDKSNKDLIIINESKTISKQTLLKQWEEQCKDCKLINLIPAMVNDEPLWEITYKDSSNRYIFDYVSLYDGSQYEQLQFKRMFN